ncbi:MAG: hypothetical protein ACRDY0_01305 [Acidimicrobiales bacterium]
MRRTRRPGPPAPRRTPLATLLQAVVAGAAGTAAMDLSQYLQYRAGGGGDDPLTWEFSSVKTWEGAPAPAQIGRRLFEALGQRSLPDGAANRANNVMHWGYGLSWAAAYGVLAGSAGRPRVRWGPMFGTAVFLADYALLPPTGLYQAIWTYDSKALAKDWGAHLVFGTVTAAAFAVLSRRRSS